MRCIKNKSTLTQHSLFPTWRSNMSASSAFIPFSVNTLSLVFFTNVTVKVFMTVFAQKRVAFKRFCFKRGNAFFNIPNICKKIDEGFKFINHFVTFLLCFAKNNIKENGGVSKHILPVGTALLTMSGGSFHEVLAAPTPLGDKDAPI